MTELDDVFWGISYLPDIFVRCPGDPSQKSCLKDDGGPDRIPIILDSEKDVGHINKNGRGLSFAISYIIKLFLNAQIESVLIDLLKGHDVLSRLYETKENYWTSNRDCRQVLDFLSNLKYLQLVRYSVRGGRYGKHHNNQCPQGSLPDY